MKRTNLSGQDEHAIRSALLAWFHRKAHGNSDAPSNASISRLVKVPRLAGKVKP